jgi:succinate dehydrogenase hydrophobic anchor subunit
MNFRRIRALAGKELHRLALNRGAIVMAFLLAAAALLVSSVGSLRPTMLAAAEIRTCWVDYWETGPWVAYLHDHVPADMRERIRFRAANDIPTDRTGTLQYANTECAIQLRRDGDRWTVWFWFPGSDSSILAPFETWFWRTSRQFFHDQAIAAASPENREAVEKLVSPPIGGDPAELWRELNRQYRDQLLALAPNATAIPELSVERSSLHAVDLPRALGVALVLFAIFFVGVCLLPSLTCEEREMGTLLAQTLAPTTAVEIVTAKVLVFVPLAAGLAFVIGGLIQPAIWRDALFAAVMIVAGFGAVALGLVIALLASSQRAASLAAMGYAFSVALVVFAAQRAGLTGICQAALEYHLPPLVLAAFDGNTKAAHWQALVLSAVLATAWMAIAALVAQRRGWRP